MTYSNLYQTVLRHWIWLRGYWSLHWLQIVTIAFVAYIVMMREVSIQLDLSSPPTILAAHTPNHQATALNTSLVVEDLKSDAKQKEWKDRRANRFANLGFILNPTYAKRHNVDQATVGFHMNNCKNYVKRFAKVAQTEQEKFGIPASITLAQGLLESDAGDSRLAVESSNHFGIKCRSKCKGCTCRNYTDDSQYDMFRVFGSAWESYREHSLLLTGDRYKHLLDLDISDYRAWAHGLKKAGYATDKRYAEKLIAIVESLELSVYDR
ncbi:MAG: glucosaminidase domain-containing protein [Bacteroidota bacterium]